MKSCRSALVMRLRIALVLSCGVAMLSAAAARDVLPTWEQFTEAGSKIERALFREMAMPGGAVVSRRPPSEAKPLLDNLVRADANNAELYSLRALEEEQELDFAAAEKDWAAYATHAPDRATGQIALADFYHRRGRPADEIAALDATADSVEQVDEQFTPAAQQKSWAAFERIFQVIGANGFGGEISVKHYDAWIKRYPRESGIYSKYFDYLLSRKKFADAVDLLARYSRAFPDDQVFAVKNRAQLEFRRGNREQSLAVYDGAFEPLWPHELIQGYFDLLRQTDGLRKFLERSRSELTRNPDDLNATARIFSTTGKKEKQMPRWR